MFHFVLVLVRDGPLDDFAVRRRADFPPLPLDSLNLNHPPTALDNGQLDAARNFLSLAATKQRQLLKRVGGEAFADSVVRMIDGIVSDEAAFR